MVTKSGTFKLGKGKATSCCPHFSPFWQVAW